MSSFRSLFSNMPSASSSTSWLSLLIGLFLGLLAGLIIGWVVWPVEWEGAYLNELLPSQRAEYLAAVADSYAYSQSPEALDTAARRVDPLRANLNEQLDAAITHFQQQGSADSNIRVMNLAQLANALGAKLSATGDLPAAQPVVVEIPVQQSELTGSEVSADAASASVATTSSAAETTTSSFNLLGFLTRLLVALLLIAGGLYLFRWLSQRSLTSARQADDEEQRLGRPAQGDDDYEFDADDNEFGEPEFNDAEFNNGEFVTGSGNAANKGWARPTSVAAGDFIANQRYRTANEEAEADFDTSWDDDDQSDEDNADGDNADDEFEVRRQERHLNPRGDSYQPDVDDEERATPDSFRHRSDRIRYDDASRFRNDGGRSGPSRNEWEDDRDLDELDADPDDLTTDAASEAPPPPTRAASAPNNVCPRPSAELPPPRDRQATASQPAALTGSGFTGVKPLETFEFSYEIGEINYSESFPIYEANGKGYIGECGLGVSTKNNILHKNTDEVVALELWLFDKADDRNLSNQMRVLLSEYADTHYRDAFNRERNGETRPFVAQTGTRFQVEGKHLILNGEIVDVSYSREGIFQRLRVKTDVLRR